MIRTKAAHGYSTSYPHMDFETYSEAGYVFDKEQGRFRGLSAHKKGIQAVGSAAYARHPSTDVNHLAYDLKDGLGPRLWEKGDPPPWDLIAYLQAGGLIEAHNSGFEYAIWTHVCVPKLGWPPIDYRQLRCSMAKAAAFALPMALDKLADALDTPVKKDAQGKAVMLRLSQPRTPTKADPSLRFTPQAYPDLFRTQGQYCITDIETEGAVSERLPDLSPTELELWLLDQEINIRGVHIDRKGLEDCICIVEQAFAKYAEELKHICGGYYDPMDGHWRWNVESPAELEKIKAFLFAKGVRTNSLDAEHLAALLARDDLPPDCRRVLEIRDMLGASSVKKLFSLLHHLCDDDRVRGLFAFCGADRTGRFAGRGPQPQNMPSGGPSLRQCDKTHGCGHLYQAALTHCPWCHADAAFSDKGEWGPEGVEQALKVIASRNLHYVEHYYGDAVAVISGCLRGLFTAAPGKDFICSDFSAIEAVVLAELAGETWRQEVFRTHGKIYEMSAAKITGTPFEEFMACAGYTDLTKPKWWEAPQTGPHHKLRKTLGKVSELASGYAGWIGAWKNFGADKFLNDDEIKQAILAWRDASPAIVEFWGGQWRKTPGRWEWRQDFYGLEGAAVQAIMNPGQAYACRAITYQVHEDVLYCRLPSGRLLSYHQPRLYESQAPHGNPVWQITYMGQDEVGRWVRLDTYGGKLAENCLIGSSLVLTDSGWKRLDAISTDDLVHDGVEFVNHGGTLYKSIQPCVSMDGVLMTEDHHVLSPNGWQAASQCERPYRPKIRRAHLHGLEPHGRKKEPLVFPLRVWQILHEKWCGRNQRSETRREAKLWLYDQEAHRGAEYPARYDKAPGVRGLAFNDRPLSTADASSMAQLRRAWNFGVRSMARAFREFLGRHGAHLRIGAGAGSGGQRRQLLQGELPVGYAFGEYQQQTGCSARANALRGFHGERDVPTLRIEAERRLPPVEPEMATRRHDTSSRLQTPRKKTVIGEFPVYDILNCGPRNRFVVKGDNGPFIVHNCTQAVARDILTHAMLNLAKAGYPIVLHIHDEIVAEVDKGWGSIEEFERIMATMPEWCKDWPVRAAGGWRGLRYRKG